VLEDVFTDLLQRVPNPPDAGEYWHEIEAAHSGPGRFYHTLAHLEHLTAWLETARPLADDFDLLLFAAFYHDLVYHIPGPENEEQSAGVAAERLHALGLDHTRIERCRRHILATKRHEASPDFDTNLFTDADLAILGDAPEAYRRYTENVRREYGAVPEMLFRAGRKGVVMHFLKRKRIYQTDWFFEKLEERARENLAAEMEGLG
jgi:predicted metal-dependent HD superfamily phosphohydrolase